MAITKNQMQSLYQKCDYSHGNSSQFSLTYACRNKQDSDQLQLELAAMVKSMQTGSGAAFGVEYMNFDMGNSVVTSATIKVVPAQTALGLMNRSPTQTDWRNLATMLERTGAIPVAQKARIDSHFTSTGKIQRS